MNFRVVEGFDGAWILLDDADGKTHYVGGAFEHGAMAARAALPRIRVELETWGADRWCATYSVDPRALALGR